MQEPVFQSLAGQAARRFLGAAGQSPAEMHGADVREMRLTGLTRSGVRVCT
jgi:hypothetical protein